MLMDDGRCMMDIAWMEHDADDDDDEDDDHDDAADC